MNKLEELVDDYLDQVRRQLGIMLRESLGDSRDDAKAIIEAHLQRSESKLRRWSVLLANGQLTGAEFRLLIKNQISLTRMKLSLIETMEKKRALELRDRIRAMLIDLAFELLL